MQRLIPYGDSNFERIINENKYYVDKTMYIEPLEKVNWPVFLRPRRFGKTLFTETLRWYYDLKAADRFDELFGKLYIGKKPTPNHNKYFFLKLDFSGMSAWSESEVNFIKEQFDSMVSTRIRYFLDYYKNELNIDYDSLNTFEKDYRNNASGALTKAIAAVHNVAGKMFIAIDEYDSLTNAMAIYYKDATEDENEYLNILKKGGFFRGFFETIKSGTSTSIAQTYITGILPITIADMNSGYNIAKWITFHPWFSNMLGITKDEFSKLLDEIYSENSIQLKRKRTIEICEKYYNGYKFNTKSETVYNPMMTLYVLDNIINFGTLPQIMADNNLRIEYNQIAYLFGNNTEKRDEIITQITNKKEIEFYSTLQVSFNMDDYKEGKYITEGLFYSGILSYSDNYSILRIPNLVTYEFVLSYFNRIMAFETGGLLYTKIISGYAKSGNVSELIGQFFNIVIQEFPGDFFKNVNESFYHGLLFYIIYNALPNDLFEVLPEFQLTNGKVDLMVRSFKDEMVKHSLNDLFELKQVPKSATDSQFKVRFEEAKSAMKGYLTGKYANWRGIAICFRGNKDYLIEIFD